MNYNSTPPNVRGRRLSRRPARASRPSRATPARRIAVPRSRLYSADAVHCFQRRVADIVVYATGGGTFAQASPPAFSGSQFLSFGTPYADSGIPAFNPYILPFALQWSLTTLSEYVDFIGMFREYQVDSILFEAELLSGQSASDLVPEITLASDPQDAIPPASVQTLDSFADVSRHALINGNIVRKAVVPRPSIDVYGPSLGGEFGYLADSRAMWLNTGTSNDAPFYGIKGFLRNFPTNGANVAVRLSGTAYLRFRRPH